MTTGCECCGGAAHCSAGANRPGLGAIAYRAGTHASFFKAMKARLSSAHHPELATLNRRDSADPAIALLDAWAVTADVLTFYSERIANEHYLRTATERRSVLELARLTGYRLRPGVAASVFLAYELEALALPLTLPIGTRVQSVPAPGETMQTFETAELLEARAQWNSLRPRQSQPQARTAQTLLTDGIYLQGVSTQLKVNDAVLVVLGATLTPMRVDRITEDAGAGRTHVRLRDWNGVANATMMPAGGQLEIALTRVNIAQRPQPANALRLPRSAEQTFKGGADVFPQLLQHLNPLLRSSLYAVLGNAQLGPPVQVRMFALRARASLFAHNAPNQPHFKTNLEPPGFAVIDSVAEPTIRTTWGSLVDNKGHPPARVALDRAYEQIKPGLESYVVIDRPAVKAVNAAESVKVPARLGVHKVNGVKAVTMATLIGAALDVTQLLLEPVAGAATDGTWLADLEAAELTSAALDSTDLLRGTRVYGQSEELALAEEPLSEPLCDEQMMHEIELDALYDGLKPGRWLAISGQRSDVGGIANIQGAELAMLAAVRHGLKQVPDAAGKPHPLPGDKIHTFITLAEPLTYCYHRESAAINANVVRATHGETRREVAGGGDPTQAMQQFPLKQAPLTFVAAPAPSGVASTLSMWVNNVRWPEVASLIQLAPSQRGYISRRDNDERSSVIFGDGVHGARLPGGADNIRAIYRSGIGKGGNVAAGQITLVTDKPLGVKAVYNPMRGSGGAGPDTIAQARVNAPLAVMALDRLVSVRDYADFARLFAGIGKAGAALLPGAGGQLVQVVIAGIDDIPIDPSSDLYRNLAAALRRFGDPHMRVRLLVREALALVIEARVALKPGYAWENVGPALRDALNAAYGFARAELGQDVFVSAILATVQKVEGVAYAKVRARVFDQLALVVGLFEAPPKDSKPLGATTGGETVPIELGADPADAANPCADMRIAVKPTQIAYLSPEVPDSLILELL